MFAIIWIEWNIYKTGTTVARLIHSVKFNMYLTYKKGIFNEFAFEFVSIPQPAIAPICMH